MADQDALTRGTRKFLFDVHNFDEPEVPDPDAPPPPPVFTESEMASSRNDSFEKGRQAGLAEAEASREKAVLVLVETMTGHFSDLFDGERKRSQQFEAETLLLAREIFEKLFPLLNETHGLAEVEKAVAAVLENQRQQPDIIVEVHSDFLEDIRGVADLVKRSVHLPGTVTVVANDSLARGDCRMSWNDGGAERSATALSAAIRKTLEDALAGKPGLRDNGNRA